MRRRDVAKELDGPVARRLLSGAIPARFAYVALDGTPRAIPIGFLWNGREVVMCTATNSAKVKALKANPQIALTIDTTDHPPQKVLMRGAVSLETVDGIPDEYLQMQSGLVPLDQWDGWLAGVRDVGEGHRLREDTAERGSGTRGETREVTSYAVTAIAVQDFLQAGVRPVGRPPARAQHARPDRGRARRFAAGWTLLSSGSEPAMDHSGKDSARHYLFQRAS